ncbi:defensin j1-2 [Phtheirospermum japonicum]|uniref:Defensin j1-2 n=1 Tax=Phtheirospermum japonicum TaxID=374723 RepID=A0A830CKA1_9LAMI|nr:defensin j1-2 [Phtheirospermum japonicum]
MMIMRSEGSTCEARSQLFKGACFRSKNCESICGKEGFTGGKCKFWRCVCSKDCGLPNDSEPGEGPPNEEGPSEGPPNEAEPGEGPPSEGQPGEGPPGEEMPPARQS